MEEKLELVKKMIELQKETRSTVSKSGANQGTMWWGATTKQANVTKGYSSAVLDNHKKT